MSVMGWLRVDLAVLLYGRLRIYPIQRNEDLISIIESASKEMFERIQADDPPEPDWTHPQTLPLIKAIYGVKEGVSVELPGEECDRWTEYQQLGDEIKELNARRDACKAQVLNTMGEAAIGETDCGYQLVRSVVSRKSYEVKAASYTQLRQRRAK
jgi:hypothetical protein